MNEYRDQSYADLPRTSILIVEDDVTWSGQILEVVNALQWRGTVAPSIEDGRRLLIQQSFAIVILDRMLGSDEADGLTLFTILCQLKNRPQTLILSQLSSTQERIRGLDSGADDYLSKPFEPEELRARLSAMHRRLSGLPDLTELNFEGLLLDHDLRSVIWKGVPTHLNEQMFRLLHTLIASRGRPVSRAMLWHEVWPEQKSLPPQNSVIEVAVYRLRQKLEEITGQTWVQSARGHGYRLART
jgi:two-component system, OmpR family, response regulator